MWCDISKVYHKTIVIHLEIDPTRTVKNLLPPFVNPARDAVDVDGIDGKGTPRLFEIESNGTNHECILH